MLESRYTPIHERKSSETAFSEIRSFNLKGREETNCRLHQCYMRFCINDDCTGQCMLIVELNSFPTYMSFENVWSIKKVASSNNLVSISTTIDTFTVTRNNKSVMRFVCEPLYASFKWKICEKIRSLLRVNKLFKNKITLQTYKEHINPGTKCFVYHIRTGMLSAQPRAHIEFTRDHVSCLVGDILM